MTKSAFNVVILCCRSERKPNHALELSKSLLKLQGKKKTHSFPVVEEPENLGFLLIKYGYAAPHESSNRLGSVSLYFLYFSAEFTFSGGTHKYKTDVIIFANGSTIWLAPAMFITVCHLDVR